MVSLLRLPPRELAVADLSGKLAVFDSAGSRLARTYQTGLLPLYDAELLPDSTLLLVGRGKDRAGPLLHVFDPRRGAVVRSFFPDGAVRALGREPRLCSRGRRREPAVRRVFRRRVLRRAVQQHGWSVLLTAVS